VREPAIDERAVAATDAGITKTVRRGSSSSPLAVPTKSCGASAASSASASSSRRCAKTDDRHRQQLLDRLLIGERAGRLRARIVARSRRARLADTLISQSCIDHDVRLVTRDDDFRPFARIGGLRLAL
jgi:predicted nucleic acid-binding protein